MRKMFTVFDRPTDDRSKFLLPAVTRHELKRSCIALDENQIMYLRNLSICNGAETKQTLLKTYLFWSL